MTEWLPIHSEAGNEPFPEQNALLREARSLLEELKPVRANNTWAVSLTSSLVLCIPLDVAKGSTLSTKGSLHSAIQLMVRNWNEQLEIVGDWQDAHYAWDYEPKTLAFRVDGHGPAQRAAALAWLATELRRPVLRDDWMILGRTICSRWRWTDESKAGEYRGLFPIAVILSHRPSRSVPAGFLDPW